MVDTISAERLEAMQDADRSFLLVDTRPPESYEAWHAPGAVNYPFDPDETLDHDPLDDIDADHDGEPIVAICAKGISSSNFAEELAAVDGYDVRAVDGGMEAWSQVYDVVPLDVGGDDVDVRQVQRRAKGCLGYVVGSPGTGEAAVVDATRNVERFRQAAEDAGYEITHVFDTHVHADHISGGRELADELGVPYHLGARARERGVAYEYEPLERNDVVEVGDVSIKAIHAPGHTTEMVNYLVEDAALLTADALFVDSVGRTELEFDEEGAREGARLQFETIHGSLLSAPDDVVVLPGHVTVTDDGRFAHGSPGEPVAASVGSLRTGLDLLQTDEDAFVDALTDDVPEKPPNYETVIDINRGRRETPDDQEATELEMGPNNCSA